MGVMRIVNTILQFLQDRFELLLYQYAHPLLLMELEYVLDGKSECNVVQTFKAFA